MGNGQVAQSMPPMRIEDVKLVSVSYVNEDYRTQFEEEVMKYVNDGYNPMMDTYRADGTGVSMLLMKVKVGY